MIRRLLLFLFLLSLPIRAEATVDNENYYNTYTADGIATVFPYTFKILADAELSVYVNNVLLSPITDYAVTGAPAPSGGDVTFTSPPILSSKIVFVRNTPYTQTVDYIPNSLNADTIERSFDKLTMLTQQLKFDTSQRTLKVPSASIASMVSLETTPVSSRCIGWDVAATSLTSLNCGPTTITNNLNALNGTSLFLFTSLPGLLSELALGTEASPVTSPSSVMKISKMMGITADPPAPCTGGTIDPECGAALIVNTFTTAANTMMAVGITANVKGKHIGGSSGGSKDVIAFYGTALRAEGVGNVYGGYFEARRDVATAELRGAEIAQRNWTTTPCVVTDAGGDCVSIWVTGLSGLGTYALGTGVAIRDSASSGTGMFQRGFHCTDLSVSGSGSACFIDTSASEAVIRVGGTHFFGLDTTAATLSSAVLMKNNQSLAWGTTASPVVLVGNDATGVLLLGRGTTGASLILLGNGATTPGKLLTVQSGIFRLMANDNTTVIFQLTDAGVPSFKGGAVPTGAAASGKVLCIQADGTLHASSSTTECAN